MRFDFGLTCAMHQLLFEKVIEAVEHAPADARAGATRRRSRAGAM